IAAAAALLIGGTAIASAEPVKIGMITTLSGGGAGIGADTRDGFMLAIKLSGRKDVTVITEDDAQKPELAVQIADKMIQSDSVDVLTGII
ncbi:ABC transporter substrate-binding protein, partial [Streptomyces scabiei]|uniref:ABC transporter substrate-binding protein n=1 Tax=Streptomyces scabiei TaxID=1930 RepID=UPI0038F7951F